MTIEGNILTLAQWLSPGFPVGAFAYSHGLETAITDGTIATADDLQGWLEDILRHGTGRNDCILLRAAHGSRSESELENIGAAALAFAGSAERVLETSLQGAAFGRTTAAIWGGDGVDLPYPVAVGTAAARLEIDAGTTAAMYLQAFVANLVSAAVRAVPLGQTEGQGVLAALSPLCLQIATETASTTLDHLQSTAFLSDIAAMRHEALQPRIFRS
ncbi:urease accessory protein UreF [Gymnodinialimonas ceratoperidinii]|uniref:Urease accessory protein UreF n=1 Tax=Gymnodinialimonas ceratoperidinii TaxID=2856823 RepID=A0A8F6TY00_9RHOB|nr:urease accessory UreF family protein [Gymnodinialimonas ceratoperidinii]QXT40528.1 urease accessory protein UreF [Gymnodinialimonas ceratoperidinii]